MKQPDHSTAGIPPARAMAAGARRLGTIALHALPLLIVCAMIINTYSYSLVTAIPLIQSDAWRFLDSFLGKFIEHGFSPIDLFVQTNPADTNLPLQKMLLFFHTHYYGMDFRLEGLAGTLCAILLVGVLTRASTATPVLRWGAREYWLLAGLSLVVLSLNSTNVYTWPLATLWFMPVLLAATFMWFVYARPHARGGIFSATLLLGLTLDEVAFPVFASVYGALLLAFRCRQPGQLKTFTVYGLIGLASSRLLYRILGAWGGGQATVSEASQGSLGTVLDPAIWKAAVIPLTDSLVHQANQVSVFGSGAGAYVWIAGIGLLAAHAWFWWRAVFTRNTGGHSFAMVTLMAMGVMLLFYGLVFGILVQRVPDFGFDYFHQPRYMLFYALHLAALGMLLYRDQRHVVAGVRARRIFGAALVALILLFSSLQLRLSTLAWEHAKFLSAYTVGVSHSMGRLVIDPNSTECADIMTICDFAPEKRRRLLNILISYRLNLFSPDFQAFYRLQPFPPRPAPEVTTVDGNATP